MRPKISIEKCFCEICNKELAHQPRIEFKEIRTRAKGDLMQRVCCPTRDCTFRYIEKHGIYVSEEAAEVIQDLQPTSIDELEGKIQKEEFDRLRNNVYLLIGKRSWNQAGAVLPYFIKAGRMTYEEACTCNTCKKPMGLKPSYANESYCSSKCAGQNPLTKERRVKYSLEKYGVTNISKLAWIDAKKKATCRKNHGTDYPMQNKDVRKASLNSVRKRFGKDNVGQVETIKAKRVETFIERFGVDNPRKADSVINRIQDKRTRAEWKALSKFKKVVRDGKSYNLQGYEELGLDWLLSQGYEVEDIEAHSKELEHIKYKEKGRTRRYYPDFLLTKNGQVHTVVEVKSSYTAGLRKGQKSSGKFSPNNLRRKCKAVNKLGLKMIVLVFQADKSLMFSSESFHKSTRKHYRMIRTAEGKWQTLGGRVADNFVTHLKVLNKLPL